MIISKSSCAIFIDVENQADVQPLALIQFFERRFEIAAKTAYADFSRSNVQRMARRLAAADIDMVHTAKPVKTRRSNDNIADYGMVKQIWATYRQRGGQISAFVIVSGDHSFLGTVIALRELGKTMIVAASPDRIGPWLREEADRFIPLVGGKPTIPSAVSNGQLIHLLLSLEGNHYYLTFGLVARQALNGNHRKESARRRLFDQLEAFVDDQVLIKYTHHDPVKNKDYPAIRLNRSHPSVQQALPRSDSSKRPAL
jgi:hypothetical protein